MVEETERFSVYLWTDPIEGERFYAEVEEIPDEELDEFFTLIEWYFLDQGGIWRECPYCGDKYSYFPYGIQRQHCYRNECTEKARQAEFLAEKHRKREERQLQEKARLKRKVERESIAQEKQEKEAIHHEKVKMGFGHIYIFGAPNDLYKIGLTTTSVKKRFDNLNMMSPVPLRFIHSFESMQVRSVEAQLHEKFKENRKHGEWFELSQDDLNWLKSNEDYGLDSEI